MKTFTSRREAILAGALFAGFAAVEWRLFKLQVLRHEELEEKAEHYRFTSREDQAWRGQIRDCNRIKLAVTRPVKDVYADLEVWKDRVEPLARIAAALLGVSETEVSARVHHGLSVHHGAFAGNGADVLLLKRGVEPEKWTAIKEALAREFFGLPTIKLTSRQRTLLKGLRRWTLFAQDDQRRFFPYGESLAQVLGFVGTGTNGHQLQGAWGVEAALDSTLAGQNGLAVSSQDAAGNELAFCRTTDVKVCDGANVNLTIDLRLQKIVEEALAKTVARYSPRNASCVVVRPATGEILALASLPAFSPQQPGDGPQSAWRNHAISDRNEVGSVFKVITLAAALELGVVNLDERIDCENGRWVYKKLALHDDGHRNGLLPVRECLARSSNIGLAKVGLRVGKERLYDFINRFGFVHATGVPLPYETPGYVRAPQHWSDTSITRVAIGQELGVSQLQLAMAFAAIANDGKLMRPLLVGEVEHANGTLWERYQLQCVGSVVRAETARKVREAMQGVVDHGTGTAAALPDYTVAGKTGTAQKSDGYHYVPGRLYCSFAGMVPAGKPELVIAVAVDEPKDSAYGGVVAAPVFREIAQQAMRLYRIAPDKGTGLLPQPAPVGGPRLPGDMLAMNP